MAQITLTRQQAKSLWLRAQGLDQQSPYGQGGSAVKKAIQHLGYVQIDTINVIERCHHHILFSRIPNYQRKDLWKAQAKDKSIFEYWTHALSYVPTEDFRFFVNDMKRTAASPSSWFRTSSISQLEFDLNRVVKKLKTEGPISIRDVTDDVLVEKTHPWASQKPSKKAMQWGFYSGKLVVSERIGMLKKYDQTLTHFGWNRLPKPATENETCQYLIERALRSQALISLDSVCYLNSRSKKGVREQIEQKTKRKELIEIKVKGIESIQFWLEPQVLEIPKSEPLLTHILSPFDPLIIQRKRLEALFEYRHVFEAYIPKEKRLFGYFTLPVLIEDEVVALLDLKTDRQNQKLLMNNWIWLKKGQRRKQKELIEQELHRFAAFQLSK